METASAMKRREFLGVIGGTAMAWPMVARAQQPEPMRRIGVLVGLSENDPEMKERLAGFRQGLEKLGWSEGRNVRIDYRFAPAGTQAHLLARELVALQPDVITHMGDSTAMPRQRFDTPWEQYPKQRASTCCNLRSI
ncbi:hypothetical protein [Bradyrhizobium sp. AUGA SZCCT0283]|uniref:hypothetical protein n=1 Tax=Bradyrhizobium sp. AUGA SZCCT0283 TaxID=2807671 RepID=UPI001BAE0878|nr:hypothetical protein [Bradyrhizobium sp. AUGA SZCCT0283]MBR1276102.1 hypothetical protein [Bradyrhizobium sp. AUGA SZCCT0283]